MHFSKESIRQGFDLLLSLIILFLLIPLFICISLAIKITSPGPIFYRQERLGKRGKPFKCYKFRTMYTDAETILEQILADNSHLYEEWQRHQKLKKDPRIFPIGKILRKFSLDELPQFYNVLKGDLSIVGPRPYMVGQITQLGANAPLILSVRPGITGLWQTSGRSSTTFHTRILLDAQYVVKKSFWLDITLIAKTCRIIFQTEDAY